MGGLYMHHHCTYTARMRQIYTHTLLVLIVSVLTFAKHPPFRSSVQVPSFNWVLALSGRPQETKACRTASKEAMFQSQPDDDLGINLNFYSHLNIPCYPLLGSCATGDEGSQQSDSLPEPSLKSKRYRDKLRDEIKALESMLPIGRSDAQRRLDCQTVFRIALGYLRTKRILEASISLGETTTGSKDVCDMLLDLSQVEITAFDLIRQDLDQYLDGFLMILKGKGTICYVSQNVQSILGVEAIDLIQRNINNLVQADHAIELKKLFDEHQGGEPITVTRQLKMKKVKDSGHDFVDIQMNGKMKCLQNASATSCKQSHVLLAYCRVATRDRNGGDKKESEASFWSKHEMDMRINEVDKSVLQILGYEPEELRLQSFYGLVHPEDLDCCRKVHIQFIETTTVQSMYFRMLSKSGAWIWLHTRGKVIFKATKKYSIILSHTRVREETSIMVQRESLKRQNEGIPRLVESLSQNSSDQYQVEQANISLGNFHQGQPSISVSPVSNQRAVTDIATVNNQHRKDCRMPAVPFSVLSTAMMHVGLPVYHDCDHLARVGGSGRAGAVDNNMMNFSAVPPYPLSNQEQSECSYSISNQVSNGLDTMRFLQAGGTDISTYLTQHAHQTSEASRSYLANTCYPMMDFQNTITDIKADLMYNESNGGFNFAEVLSSSRNTVPDCNGGREQEVTCYDVTRPMQMMSPSLHDIVSSTLIGSTQANLVHLPSFASAFSSSSGLA